ncbi:MAG: lipoyl(octanoyl) transferase LipB [Anaerolineales bacterium]|nr:lipoyl(octanoyl) transferase LipB [Anaerolineales bacterium]MCZ2122819.1 lipoyl(octanoyl) transferase LipB [Anaerolineales bacterium]
MKLEVEDLGLIEYATAWKLQDDYAAEIAQMLRPPTLLLLEHPHVYTFGRKGHAENLLWGAEQLQQKGIATHWVDRGGDVTYHGPGQLVGYPLLPLGKLNAEAKLPSADYVGYIRKLEKTLIVALAKFGLGAGQRSGKTGVWIQSDLASRCVHCKPEDKLKPAKIAAIGVKVDAQGVSRHGFALNVNPNMEYWNGIIACGLQGEPIISMADLLTPTPEMPAVKEAVRQAFQEVFNL